MRNLEQIIYSYRNIDINYFLILIKEILQIRIVKPNLSKFLFNLKNIYKYILNLQNINYKNLYLIFNKNNLKKKEYIILYGIIQQLTKGKLN